MKTLKIIGVVVVVLLVVAGIIFMIPKNSSQTQTQQVNVGDDSHTSGGLELGGHLLVDSGGIQITAGGLSIASGQLFSSSTIRGGGQLATTTGPAASTTIQQSDLQYSSISIKPNLLAGFTLTLPATSTVTGFLPTAGDEASINVVNATTSVAYITILGGTGTQLQAQASTTRIFPGFFGRLVFTRKANTDIQVMLLGN